MEGSESLEGPATRFVELGIEVVRAQRTSQALDAMAHEIKRRKKELPWGA